MDEAQAEEVLLDEDAESAGHSFWDLGDLQVGLPTDQAALVQLICAVHCHATCGIIELTDSTAFVTDLLAAVLIELPHLREVHWAACHQRYKLGVKNLGTRVSVI